eukprot:TRINITY_DN181_c0_g1_i2.p1 TRINITY_DN181_c0_g1~~TRINITY_DN181_c0_g1_i2.p1  ORF type:complete len:102 (-),score=0.12 TRINITY_DN181_c0_g1_i2:347-652(-)
MEEHDVHLNLPTSKGSLQGDLGKCMAEIGRGSLHKRKYGRQGAFSLGMCVVEMVRRPPARCVISHPYLVGRRRARRQSCRLKENGALFKLCSLQGRAVQAT